MRNDRFDATKELSPISPNPLLDRLLESLWGTQNTAQHSPADSLPRAVDTMMAEEEEEKAISNQANLIPAFAYSPSSRTNRNNRFFQTEATHTTALKTLFAILLDWSANIYDPNLKVQILCLLAKADISLSQKETYQPLAPSMLSCALATISDNGCSAVSDTTQAHVYFTIAYFLETQNDTDKTGPALYKQFQALYDNHPILESYYDRQAIRHAFLAKAERLEPTIKAARLSTLLHANIKQLLTQPFLFKKSIIPTDKGLKITLTQTRQLTQDLALAQSIFNPTIYERNHNITNILQQSLQETTQLSLDALEDHNPSQAIEWADMTLTMLILTKLTGTNIWDTYFYSLENTLHYTRNYLEQNTTCNHAPRA